MSLFYNLILFTITLIGGSIPIWNRQWNEKQMKYLLAFSGSFLLGITFLHLVPETISHSGYKAGIFILIGFFLQQIIQRFTHGMEHGHSTTDHNHHHSVNYLPVFIGLSFHAFGEGLPLGITYTDEATLPSLYLAVALHKLPEAMLIASLVYLKTRDRKKTWFLLIVFSLITPLSGWITSFLGNRYEGVNNFVHFCIPIIAGIFIHIATTIFFESGTRSHDMNWKKWASILLGIGLAILSMGKHIH